MLSGAYIFSEVSPLNVAYFVKKQYLRYAFGNYYLQLMEVKIFVLVGGRKQFFTTLISVIFRDLCMGGKELHSTIEGSPKMTSKLNPEQKL